MLINEDFFKNVLERCLQEDISNVDVHTFKDMNRNRYVAHFEIESAPREIGDIILHSDSELDIDVNTGYSTEDNAPSNSIVRMGFVIEKEAMEEELPSLHEYLKNLEFEKIAFIISADMNIPSYCDDECDARLYGTLYFEIDDHEWAVQESLKMAILDIEKDISCLMATTISQIKSIRKIGGQEPILKNEISKLVREALMP